MKTKILASAGILMSGILAAGIAQADPANMASLVSVSGKVLVDQGKGFVTAKPGMKLNDSDRVITLNDSAAAVAYADGCVNMLKSNKLLTIDQEAACSKQALSTQQPLRYAAAIGDTKTDVPANAGPTAGAPAAPGLGAGMPLALGGAWGAMIIHGNNSNKDNTPISIF